ncbi:MAG: rRNA maturation RNase YbeY [Deltaproteobacteria bacterium RIFCSPLOWO2_01_44_7]|nr:MAG: rRNA maturation RNase YbeY [Deltaproteobacteria bacterium RIFCSPHIGHO2_01_FULL_43_49]OGQ16374.1 MAG: rRNA maturation RNase YbeY [Deltaproteobacteria bacterium RIFCSPHIGHO2_02_FULL_44_53]OGQ27800.1 MAG: rRNA maturation RNase YbeY [Deltaproteobacteria bacterium RIFCSPHIGHO2_12_FULL_44_21]OGQ32892.1 MAG: rRNA maturation RNase YbeY [Deltaproteobacteria bacterium RIFCSPLOWO2_01_FULL_45_74]OGQ37611.1 MAG: rRNA maturation RNase YbeY [Deltaproteobacteria bacterium RIFCSPLOWO2_01_44_7]OGQ41993.
MCIGFNFQNSDISFLFTSSAEIKKYHQRFLKKKTATDVITFADKKAVDIVISLDQAQAQARPRGLKLFHEVCLLMCHGLLHAKGFDDLNEKDWLEMRKAEFESLARAM